MKFPNNIIYIIIQFFNTKIMSNYIAQLAITLQDIYISCIRNIIYLQNYIIIKICQLITWYFNSGVNPQLLGAYIADCKPVDVTIIMQVYYYIDSYISCASAYRWLSKFGYSPEILVLIFKRDKQIYTSTINLDTEIDSVLETEIINGDIDLKQLIGTPVCYFGDKIKN